MLNIFSYCSTDDAVEFARLRRVKRSPWIWVASAEWSESPWHAGKVQFYAAKARHGERWALLSVDFPPRVAAVAEADHDLKFEDIVGFMLRKLHADGGEYIELLHDFNDDIDIDRVMTAYAGQADAGDR